VLITISTITSKFQLISFTCYSFAVTVSLSYTVRPPETSPLAYRAVRDCFWSFIVESCHSEMEPGHGSPGHESASLEGSGRAGQCVRPGVWPGFEF